MPEMNGWECLRALKGIPEARNIPIYIYSTSKRENDRVAARRMGAVELVTKASDYRKFKDTVAGILLCRPKHFSRTNPIRNIGIARKVLLKIARSGMIFEPYYWAGQ